MAPCRAVFARQMANTVRVVASAVNGYAWDSCLNWKNYIESSVEINVGGSGWETVTSIDFYSSARIIIQVLFLPHARWVRMGPRPGGWDPWNVFILIFKSVSPSINGDINFTGFSGPLRVGAARLGLFGAWSGFRSDFDMYLKRMPHFVNIFISFVFPLISIGCQWMKTFVRNCSLRFWMTLTGFSFFQTQRSHFIGRL